MKTIFAFFILTAFLSLSAKAQKEKPQLLKEPAGWAFERFALPPVFAPAIPYHGVEELRFSPGMFKKDSADYFTYAFVAQPDSTTHVSKENIRNYLLLYFKGLCGTTAKERKLVIDTSKITVAIEKAKAVNRYVTSYDAQLNIFGVFTDGAPLKLNMEIKVLRNKKKQKTYLLFIVSPREKTAAVWKELYAIQENFVLPV